MAVHFPPVELADESGCLMVGGELNAQWLLEAYRRGIFPWPIDFGRLHVLAWFAPELRAIFELEAFHISRSLRRTIRSNRFEISFNRCFRRVIGACALPRGDDDGTWITPELVEAYVDLHNRGFAHSVEAWRHDQLVGGVYGVSLGGYFSAESMFYTERDASKVALAALVQRLQDRGYHFLDIQVWSDHTGSLGATEISRRTFGNRLEAALAASATFN